MSDNRWGLVDDKGFVYTGTEEEMREIFGSHIIYRRPDREDEKIEGDLRLVEIHAVTR